MRPLNALDAVNAEVPIKSAVTSKDADAIIALREALAKGEKEDINTILSAITADEIDIAEYVTEEDVQQAQTAHNPPEYEDEDVEDEDTDEYVPGDEKESTDVPVAYTDNSSSSDDSDFDEDMDDFDEDFNYSSFESSQETETESDLTTTEFVPSEQAHPQTTSETIPSQPSSQEASSGPVAESTQRTETEVEDDFPYDEESFSEVEPTVTEEVVAPIQSNNVPAEEEFESEDEDIDGEEQTQDPLETFDPNEGDPLLAKVRKGEIDIDQAKQIQKERNRLIKLGQSIDDAMPRKFFDEENEEAVELFGKAMEYIKEALQVMGNTGVVPESAEIKYDDKMVITHFPLVIPFDAKELVQRSGNDKFIEFMKNVQEKIGPMVSQTITDKFEEQYSTLPESLVGQIVTNKDTGFEFYVEQVTEEGVVVYDVEFEEDGTMNKGDIPENVTTAVFRDEFELSS